MYSWNRSEDQKLTCVNATTSRMRARKNKFQAGNPLIQVAAIAKIKSATLTREATFATVTAMNQRG